MTQEVLATAMGVERSFIARLETGVRRPSRTVIDRLMLLGSPFNLMEVDKLYEAAGFIPTRKWKQFDDEETR